MVSDARKECRERYARVTARRGRPPSTTDVSEPAHSLGRSRLPEKGAREVANTGFYARVYKNNNNNNNNMCLLCEWRLPLTLNPSRSPLSL